MIEEQRLIQEIENLSAAISQQIKVNSNDPLELTLNRNYHQLTRDLSELKKRLNPDGKYQCAFVGEIGTGKSTAINHLFGLVDEKGEVLKTGSGGTTLCQVEITFAERKTSIGIEPMDLSEAEKLAREFFEKFIEEEQDNQKSFPVELARFIRNFTGYTINQKIIKKNDIEKTDLLLKNLEAYQGSPTDWLEVKVNELKDKICEKPNQKLVKSFQDKKEENEFLKNHFKKINDGSHTDFSLPAKISIELDSSLFSEETDLDFIKYFSRIIDTKGLDSASSSNTDGLIKDDQTLTIFNSTFNNAPAPEIRSLAQSFLNERSRNYHYGFCIMVLPQNNEPRKENDADNDWDIGVSNRKENVFESITANPDGSKFSFIKDNILFYDSKRNIEQENDQYDDDTGFESSKHYHRSVKKDIIQVFKTRLQCIERDFQLIKKKFGGLKNNLSTYRDHLSSLGKQLLNIAISVESESFAEDFISRLLGRYPHWKTRLAIAKRDGQYPFRGIYIDGDLQRFTKDFLRRQSKNTYSTLNQFVGKSLESQIEDETNRKMLNEYLDGVMQKFYDDFLDEVAEELRQAYIEERDATDFWSAFKVKPFGAAYFHKNMEDKLAILESQSDQSINDCFSTSSHQHWEGKVLYRLAALLGHEV